MPSRVARTGSAHFMRFDRLFRDFSAPSDLRGMSQPVNVIFLTETSPPQVEMLLSFHRPSTRPCPQTSALLKRRPSRSPASIQGSSALSKPLICHSLLTFASAFLASTRSSNQPCMGSTHSSSQTFPAPLTPCSGSALLCGQVSQQQRAHVQELWLMRCLRLYAAQHKALGSSWTDITPRR